MKDHRAGQVIMGLASLPCFALAIFAIVFSWTGPCHNARGLSLFQMSEIPFSEKVTMGAMIVIPSLAGMFLLTIAGRAGKH